MANTITNTRSILGDKHVVQYVTIASDGSQETDLIIYDSSVVATALGIADPLHCFINGIQYSSNSALGVIKIEFDATTDILAWAFPFGGEYMELDFTKFGGLQSTGNTGKTGDILLTTTGLAAGDSVAIVIDIRPH